MEAYPSRWGGRDVSPTTYFEAEQVPAPQLACALPAFFAGAAGALGFAGVVVAVAVTDGPVVAAAAPRVGVATVVAETEGVAPAAAAVGVAMAALGVAGAVTEAAAPRGAAPAAGAWTSTDWTGT
jgi:hypothetical protein